MFEGSEREKRKINGVTLNLAHGGALCDTPAVSSPSAVRRCRSAGSGS